MKRTLYYLTLFILWSGQLVAQELATVEALPTDGREARYMQGAGPEAVIFDGELEPRYLTRLEGHAYLDTDEYQKGTLLFDGREYPSMEMRLNTHIGRLVVLTSDRKLPILIAPEYMECAKLPEYDIYYIEPMGEKNTPLAKTFYARLETGKYPLWKHSHKYLKQHIKDMTVINSFEEKLNYYVEKDGIFHEVNSKGALLKLFPEHKAALNRYIKSERLDFRRAKETALLRALQYCGTL